MKNSVFTFMGWLGAGLILTAFGLLSFGIITAKDGIYHLLNLIGAMGIVVDGVYKKDWPPAVLNIVWFLIALVSLIF